MLASGGFFWRRESGSILVSTHNSGAIMDLQILKMYKREMIFRGSHLISFGKYQRYKAMRLGSSIK
jgi:hypothetical protein